MCFGVTVGIVVQNVSYLYLFVPPVKRDIFIVPTAMTSLSKSSVAILANYVSNRARECLIHCDGPTELKHHQKLW